MAEALVRLKSSDPYLGTTLDRLRDKKFEEAFKKSYELANGVRHETNIQPT